MKKYLLISSFLILLFVDSMAQKRKKLAAPVVNSYKYEYVLDKPYLDSNLAYKDENVDVKFEIGTTWVRLILKNKLEAPIKINWDDASLIQKEKSERIINSNVDFSKKSQPQPPTTIPPLATLDISLIEERKVYFGPSYTDIYDFSQRWRQDNLLVSNDAGDEQLGKSLMDYVGHTVSLYIPITIKGNQRDYYFTFRVKSVTKVPERERR